MEGRALLRYVRWILRSKKRFGHRLVVLLDSKVVIGAVTKGRSSSRPLNALLRQLAALCFAGGLVLHCVFIPTSHNPSDWPSRGGPATWPSALRKSTKPVRAPHATKWERESARLGAVVQRLKDTGMLAAPDCDSDFSDLASVFKEVPSQGF